MEHEITHPLTITDGLSPKAVLAFLFPVVASVLAALASYVVTGNFSDSEIRTAVGGVILSGIAGLGAYTGHPGTVQTVDVGTPSDAKLPPEAHAVIAGDTPSA